MAVLEVGLGGRLDSTNICQPLVSVITSISFDHTRQLGNTLAAIAGEKAGIIKPGAAVISGVTANRAARGDRRRGRASRLPPVGTGPRFYLRLSCRRAAGRCRRFGRRSTLSIAWPIARLQYRGLELALIGEHQGANAAVALAVLVELARSGFVVPEPAVRTGLATVEWPARLEILARRPLVVVDAAHNVASIEAFVATLDQSFAARPRVLVFATTCDKDVRGMLRGAGRPFRADHFYSLSKQSARIAGRRTGGTGRRVGRAARPGGRRSAGRLGCSPRGSRRPKG